MTRKLCTVLFLIQIFSYSSRAGGSERTISRKIEIIDTLRAGPHFKDGYQLRNYHVEISDELVEKHSGRKAKAVGNAYFVPSPPWSKSEPAIVQCNCQTVSKVNEKGDTLYKVLYNFHVIPVPRTNFRKNCDCEYVYAYKCNYDIGFFGKVGDSLFYEISNGPMYVGFGLRSLFVWNAQSNKWDLVYRRPKKNY